MDTGFCHLDAAMGRRTPCPGDECPFWKDERCLIQPLQDDLAKDACLVTTLVGMRAALRKQSAGDALRVFHPPGLV